MFGDELKVKPVEPFALGFDLKSVAGLKQAELIGGGAVLKTETFADAPREPNRCHACPSTIPDEIFMMDSDLCVSSSYLPVR